MREKFVEIFFRSPERRKLSLVYFAGAVLFLGLYFLRDGGLFALMMFSGFFLTGLSEFLSEERNVLAGVLRLTAIAVYLVILALSLIQPGLIF